MNRLKNHWGLAAVIATVIGIYSLLPLGTALQFGEDEGYQLITGFMMSRGFALYTQIWNDQPPVHVLLLDWAFREWGPSILAARLISAGFGLLLFGAFFQLTRQQMGRRAAFLAAFFLLSAPTILELSVSAMQEVPTFALALVSVCFLFQWRKTPHWAWLLASGATLGLALGIKLTAILVVPAMFVEMWLKFPGRASAKKVATAVLQWGIAAIVVFTAIMLVWGQGSFQMSFRSHFAEHVVNGLPHPEDFPIRLSILLNHAECVLAAAVGIALIARRRKWREFAFPIVMLMTMLAVHAVHRPWWDYYYLHIAIPLCWLAGYAADEAIICASDLLSKRRFDLASKKTWKGAGLCALIALFLVRSEGRLENGVKLLQHRGRVDADPIVARMKEYAARTHWVYAQYGEGIYPFQAHLSMPPEIAMVTLKRYWSGQITTEEIVETCKRYQVEQVLLDPARTGNEWKDFLTNYDAVYQSPKSVLYVAKRIESSGDLKIQK